MLGPCSQCKGDGETDSLEVIGYLSAYVYSVVNSSWVRLTTCRLEDRHALEWPQSTYMIGFDTVICHMLHTATVINCL